MQLSKFGSTRTIDTENSDYPDLETFVRGANDFDPSSVATSFGESPWTNLPDHLSLEIRLFIPHVPPGRSPHLRTGRSAFGRTGRVLVGAFVGGPFASPSSCTSSSCSRPRAPWRPRASTAAEHRAMRRACRGTTCERMKDQRHKCMYYDVKTD